MAAALVFVAMLPTSCSNKEDSSGRQDDYEGVPLVILDTDIGSSTDDLCARLIENVGFFATLVSSPQHSANTARFALCARLIENVGFFATLVFSPRHSANTARFALCARLIENVQFSLSERGTVSLTPQAEAIFTPSATGNCRYQLPGNEARNAAMLQKIRASVISKYGPPLPHPRRGVECKKPPLGGALARQTLINTTHTYTLTS